MQKFFALVLYTLVGFSAAAQTDTGRADSTTIDTKLLLTEVQVKAYFTYQPLLNAPFTVNTIDSSLVHGNHGMSLLPVMNLGPGIRMEERSPGSYRLSVRGSLLRSPFGVRNVKVYFDEFAFTDASGNTYLNLVDISSINRLEILRGPDASLFGANTGGVLRFQVFDTGIDTCFTQAGAGFGAYGFFRQNVQTRQQLGKHVLAIGQSWQRSDGYRQHSSMDRKTFVLTDEWRYSKNAGLKILALYSDLDYLTPGGLTLQEWQSNPRQARPLAAEQKAGVHNQTLYGGISHEIKLGRHFTHLVAVSGANTNFNNPFITNDEVRSEQNAGLRTWIGYGTSPTRVLVLSAYLGLESQKGWYDISNYGNRQGIRDTLQARDVFTTFYVFGFARLNLAYKRKFSLELSLSRNENSYAFSSRFPPGNGSGKRNFETQLMPRAAFSWRLVPSLSWRVMASRGYSPPTLAEVRPAGNSINNLLQPESGWNYETGFRFKSRNTRIYIDLAGFYFELDHAIVRRQEENGTEYFVNAGGTRQAGLELQFDLILLDRPAGWIRKLKLCRSYTLSLFRFGTYSDGENDYSGNRVTGVPVHSAITGGEIEFAHRLYFFAQYQFTSKIPLNDANSVYLPQAHLVQIKLTWTRAFNAHSRLSLFAGIDNLLNWKYSLGSDINAFGGRYYNAAPGLNAFGGFSVVF